MKYLPLLWGGIWRKPVRTALTLFALAMAFLLFGAVQGINAGVDRTIERSRLDRLYVNPRFGGPLPIAYRDQIAQIPGVKLASAEQGLNGYVRDPKSPFYVGGVNEDVFGVYAEFDVNPADLEAFRNTRTGIIISKPMGDLVGGLKPGDKVPLHSPVSRQDGTADWVFDVIAVLDAENLPGAFLSIGHYDYINEERASGKDTVNGFSILIDDPDRGVEIAKAIDARFVNSSAATRTQVERLAFETGFANLDNLRFMLTSTVIATLFSLLLLTSNTMMQSFRERTAELAMLKTLGFSNRRVYLLVLCEAIAQCLTGAVIGLALARFGAPAIKRLMPQGPMQFLEVPLSLIAAGIGTALLVAAVSAAGPAWRANRLVIVDALSGRR